jgi:hypothetical protein
MCGIPGAKMECLTRFESGVVAQWVPLYGGVAIGV